MVVSIVCTTDAHAKALYSGAWVGDGIKMDIRELINQFNLKPHSDIHGNHRGGNFYFSIFQYI